MVLSPTLSSSDLMGVIFLHCFNRGAISETKCVKVSRLGLQALSLALTVGAGVPNIPIGLKFGKKRGSSGLGYTVIVSNFFTRFFTGTWAYLRMIKGESGSDAELKRLLSNIKLHLWQRIGIKVSVAVIAFFAQTPRAYIAYQSNNNNILYPILTYAGLVAVPAYSLDMTIKAAIEFNRLPEFERSLHQIKQDMRKQIQICRNKIMAFSRAERLIFANTFALFGHQSAELAVTNFFIKVCSEEDLPPKRKSFCDKVRGVVSRTLSSVATASAFVAQMIFYYEVGRIGSKPVQNDEAFCHTIGAIIAASNIYVTAKVTREAQRLFDQIFFNPSQLLTGNSITSILMPKIRAAVGLATLAIASFATGTMAQNVDDYFTGTLHSILEVLVPLSAFLLSHKAISDVIDDALNEVVRRSKDFESEKKLLKVDDLLKRFDHIISVISPTNFAQLLNKLPDNLFAKFVNNRISKEQLTHHINNIKPPIPEVTVVDSKSKETFVDAAPIVT